MAPNLDVKSESWLDLSRSANYYDKHCAANKIFQNNKFKLEGKQEETKFFSKHYPKQQEHRHSISNFYVPSPFESGSETAAGKQQHLAGSELRPDKSRQHLLIRLRQQSYLNRSSNSLVSSTNLSNSIDLNPSLVGLNVAHSESNCDYYQRRRQSNQFELIPEGRPVLLKRESHKLRALRNKLQSRLRPSLGSEQRLHQQAPASERELFPELPSLESPFRRSFSSFSQRLSGKLSHLRHSWKHFLHNYSHGQQQQRQEVSASNHSDRKEEEDTQGGRFLHSNIIRFSEIQVNKRQQTDDWILRHQQYLEDGSGPDSQALTEERPRSLQIINNSLAETERESPLASRPFSQLARNHELSLKLVEEKPRPLKVPTSNLKSTSIVSSANSSSTLVSSGQTASAISKLATTHKSSTSSESTLDEYQTENELEMRKRSNESPRARRLHEQKLEFQHFQPSANPTQLNQRLSKQPVATSDYWSTANSSQQIVPALLPAGYQVEQPDQYYLDVVEPSSGSEFFEKQLVENLAQNLAQTKIVVSPEVSQMAAYEQQLDEDYDDYAVPADESCCRLDRNQVELVQMIGEGQKGFVFLGKLQSRDGKSIMDVAIKTLKYETDQLIDKLMREASMMRQLEHPHIIRFIGVCPETPALIAMELAEFGELKQYLKVNKHLILTSQLVLFTFQISTALSYLESKQYVHRDVAARNILVCSHNCVKLADFGLSRNLQLPSNSSKQLNSKFRVEEPEKEESLKGSDQNYVAAARGKLPVRWLAPESLTFRRFTSASDVWMFAVCAWELFHLGHWRPWSHIRNNQVLLAIESGQRLERPPKCPARLYEEMLQCWSYAPVQRPKFRDLKQSLWSIYLNERAKEQLELERQERLLAASRQQQLQQDRLMLLMSKQQVGQQANLLAVGRQQQLASSGNVSGYSSTSGLTAEHSNNSSRSSSMGSLARQQAKLWNAERRRELQRQLPEGQAERKQPEATSEKRRALVESNMRRFERAPGQVLQKQRSQGSIVVEPAKHEQLFCVRRSGRSAQQQQYGYDDNELLARRQRQRKQLNYIEEKAAGADDDYDSSTASEEQAELGARGQPNRLWRAGPQQPARPVPPAAEPTYEGLQEAGQVAAARREGAGRRLAQARPASLQLVGPNLRQSPQEFSRDERLAEALRALKSAPMQARLSYSVPKPSQAQQLEQLQRAKEQAEREEAARQLALHQRLLGHIRRPQSAASSKRRSSQLEPARSQSPQRGQPESSVDQSLMLLESLIGDKPAASPKPASKLANNKPSHKALSIFTSKR